MQRLNHAADRHAAADGHGVCGPVDSDGGEWGDVDHDGVAHVIERGAPAMAATADEKRAAVLFRVRDLCGGVSISADGKRVATHN